MGPAAQRARAAGQGAQPLHQGRLWTTRDSQGRPHPGGPRVPKSGVPAGNERPEGPPRHLCPCRRHRHHPHRRRDLLRAGGQCPHPLGCLLHAGEPGDHAAIVPGAVRPPPRGAGRELPGRAAGDPEIGCAEHHQLRSHRGAAHTRRLQLGLLRAFLPGRQARRRAGRGARPVRQGRARVHAHHPGAQARRRHLSAHRRRLPRSAGLPGRFRPSACPG